MANNDFHDLGKLIRSKADKVLEKRIKDTLNTTAKEFLQEFEKTLREDIFNKAIDDFYADYSPEIYERHPRGSGNSLYDILQTEQTEVDGEPAMRFGFDPEQAPPFTSGYNGEYGVYDQSFRKGWHGGYGGNITDENGKHVASLRPRWRTNRILSKNGGYIYLRPGEFAKVKTPSPFIEYKRKLQEYTNNEGPQRLREIFLKNW